MIRDMSWNVRLQSLLRIYGDEVEKQLNFWIRWMVFAFGKPSIIVS